jgi:hypothetical protein
MKWWMVAALVGCVAKPYVVVQQADPSPFRSPGCTLVVDAVTYEKLIYSGEPEGTRLASMAPAQQAVFQDDKNALSLGLKQRLAASRKPLVVNGPAQGGNAFIMRPSLLRYSPGGDAELLVDVTDTSGAVLDEVRVTASVANLREAPRVLGDALDRYLRSRFTCAH